MSGFIIGLGFIGFLVSIILVLKSFVKKDGLLKRNGILLGSSFLFIILGASLAEGVNGIFTFLAFSGFIAVAVCIGLVIYSSSKKTGKTKTYAKVLIASLLIFIVGVANLESPSEALIGDEENNAEESNNEAEAKKLEEKEKLEKEKQAQAEKEKAEQEKKEEIEKADREKKEAEAKQVAKEQEEKEQASKLGQLKVHYINVGQADATLLEVTEDGKKTTMVIDAGDWNKSDALDYLKAMNINQIDVLVGTHPHADHIGQMDKILHAIDVDEVWMSGNTATSQVFQRVLEAIDTTGANYVEPRRGETYQVGNLNIDILSPSSISGNANDDSIAMKITYGNVAFVFTGDAESKAEQAMVNSGQNLKADILHIGHHGSDTSTTPAFFKEVNPKVAIYSAGKNGYGHPSPTVVNRVQDANVELYGTDVHGTIIVTTDGQTYNVAPNQNGTITASKETPKQESKPKAESKPKTESKPKAETKPKAESKPKSETKPKAESKPKTESKPKPKEPVASNSCVDINSASKEQLQEIIHIGPERADLVIQGRPFSSVESLTSVKGIAAGRLADIIDQGVACVR